MMIGVAETLVEWGEIREEALCEAFVHNFEPGRGYGQGTERLILAMGAKEDYRQLARTIFPGGSLGNGAAMRVAPVGLMFCDDLDRVAAEAELSATPTHVHPLAVDGARVLALAVALAAREPQIVRAEFLDELRRRAKTDEFQWQLSVALQLTPDDTVSGFGNSLAAHRSVVTAIACFANAPDCYSEVISRAIGQGNDTDTLAAMAGAIAAHMWASPASPSTCVLRWRTARRAAVTSKTSPSGSITPTWNGKRGDELRTRHRWISGPRRVRRAGVARVPGWCRRS